MWPPQQIHHPPQMPTRNPNPKWNTCLYILLDMYQFIVIFIQLMIVRQHQMYHRPCYHISLLHLRVVWIYPSIASNGWEHQWDDFMYVIIPVWMKFSISICASFVLCCRCRQLSIKLARSLLYCFLVYFFGRRPWRVMNSLRRPHFIWNRSSWEILHFLTDGPSGGGWAGDNVEDLGDGSREFRSGEGTGTRQTIRFGGKRWDYIVTQTDWSTVSGGDFGGGYWLHKFIAMVYLGGSYWKYLGSPIRARLCSRQNS